MSRKLTQPSPLTYPQPLPKGKGAEGFCSAKVLPDESNREAIEQMLLHAWEWDRGLSMVDSEQLEVVDE